MAGLGGNVGGNDAAQRVGRDFVFPDIPFRLVFRIETLDIGHAHGEQDALAVVRHLHVLDITQAAGQCTGHVALWCTRRSKVTVIEVTTRGERLHFPDIRLFHQALVIKLERPHDERDTEILDQGIGVLVVTAAARRKQCAGGQHQQEVCKRFQGRIAERVFHIHC